MNKEKLVKLGLAAGSALLAVASTLIGNKQQEKTIEEKVAKALADQAKGS